MTHGDRRNEQTHQREWTVVPLIKIRDRIERPKPILATVYTCERFCCVHGWEPIVGIDRNFQWEREHAACGGTS